RRSSDLSRAWLLVSRSGRTQRPSLSLKLVSFSANVVEFTKAFTAFSGSSILMPPLKVTTRHCLITNDFQQLWTKPLPDYSYLRPSMFFQIRRLPHPWI